MVNSEQIRQTVDAAMNQKYTVTVGDYYFWFYGWFAAAVALAVLVLLVIVILIVKAVIAKDSESKTKIERDKDRKRNKREQEQKKSLEELISDNMDKVMAEAPPVTAYTAAEFPDGIDPLFYASEDGITLSERLKREKAYHVWCEEQERLKEQQIRERKEYFRKNDFGFNVKAATRAVETSHDDELSPAEQKKYEKIRRDNEKRLARARKLKAKEEAEAKRAARKK